MGAFLHTLTTIVCEDPQAILYSIWRTTLLRKYSIHGHNVVFGMFVPQSLTFKTQIPTTVLLIIGNCIPCGWLRQQMKVGTRVSSNDACYTSHTLLNLAQICIHLCVQEYNSH